MDHLQFGLVGTQRFGTRLGCFADPPGRQAGVPQYCTVLFSFYAHSGHRPDGSAPSHPQAPLTLPPSPLPLSSPSLSGPPIEPLKRPNQSTGICVNRPDHYYRTLTSHWLHCEIAFSSLTVLFYSLFIFALLGLHHIKRYENHAGSTPSPGPASSFPDPSNVSSGSHPVPDNSHLERCYLCTTCLPGLLGSNNTEPFYPVITATVSAVAKSKSLRLE